ncbi:Arc family DNA-binding protein [Mesorhizobium muleiense]|uniref:Arc family DNA-binding protein n=1 Tax=Mesorhizobium muleiense TaxID=1004279 RepID=UPI001F223CF8|nr:Arc family DNA-binding protein [Mesorhizobium muleiense]MCF6120506.1 Arc family DNA-binding protein [Mesorhizobium muleiense]
MPPQSDVKIRIPATLKKRLKIVAAENGRSMNAEIMARIEQSLDLTDTERSKALALLAQAISVLKGSG